MTKVEVSETSLRLTISARAFAHRPGIGVGQHSPLLAVVEVARPAETALHRPARAILEHAVQLTFAEMHRAG